MNAHSHTLPSRGLTGGLGMILLFCGVLLAALPTRADSQQPPQLLGVWYGTYPVETEDGVVKAEMWMEIAWQLSKDGWNVSGSNRWNVPAGEDVMRHGKHSMGRMAEYFDQVRGTIARDGESVVFKEVSRGNRITADLTGSDTMKADFYPAGGSEKLFAVTLNRIDTHYEPSAVNVTGIDISHHSGEVDWSTVKAQGYRFAYVKSSEGVDNPDAMFEKHWRELKHAGLMRGAYHFYVTEDDPVEQARFFASRIRNDPGTLPPAVDVELLGANTNTDEMTSTLLTFLKTLEKELGVKPMIYTTPKFWDQYYEPVFSDYHLWMAEYGVKMPKVPFGWDNWLVWQHAPDRQVPGVEKGADINFLHPGVELDSLAPGGDAGE